MKKQFFTFLMMIALVIVAGSAMAANSKTTPYVGSTHTYNLSALPSGSRLVSVFLTDDAAKTNYLTPGAAGAFQITSTTPTWAINSNVYEATVDATSLSVAIKWTGTGLTADGTKTYKLWIQVHEGATSATCYNNIFLDITPSANIIDFIVEGVSYDGTFGNLASAGAEATTCLDEPTGRTQGQDFTVGNTTLYYRVSRVDGTDIAYDWQFDLAIDGDGFTVASTVVNQGAASVITPSGSSYRVTAGVNAVLVTVTINNAEGTTGDVEASISNATEFVGTTTTVNLTEAATALANQNSDAITVSPIPTIGTFN